MDSEGDDSHYSDYEVEEGGEEAEDSGEDELDYAPITINRRHKHYKILKEEEIRKLQDEYISDVCNVLSVSRSVACTLLCKNNWIPSSVYDEWFADDGNKLLPIIIESPNNNNNNNDVCKICYETTRIKNIIIRDTLSAVACGHHFCTDCWRTYISTSIKDGPGCLTLTCPEPGCKSHPGPDMVDSLASADDKDKYCRYLYRSYIESNNLRRKWCPAPGCDFAIEFNNADADESKSDSYQVTCDCGYKLCWNCREEGHSPLDCQKVAKWMEKNSSEAANTTWILAYTKPCPKCRRAIEKSQGCNRMRCRVPCGFEFCWMCLEPWTKHGYTNPCNKYNANDDSDSTDERSHRKKAKKHIQRYTHYYERWDSNDNSRKRAVADLNNARNEHVDRLSKTQQEPPAQLKFVIVAWEQIVECRRVLKWSYAYGYYLSERSGSCSSSSSSSGKLRLFGHLQGEAESGLERLHHCAEKEMCQYMSPDCPNSSKEFNNFRAKLTGLTSVTKNYFQNLVEALENNLSEVETEIVDSSKARRSPDHDQVDNSFSYQKLKKAKLK